MSIDVRKDILMVQKTYSRQNCDNDKCQCEYKKLIKNCAGKEK